MKKSISPTPKKKKQAPIKEQQQPIIVPSPKSRTRINILYATVLIFVLCGAGYSFIKYQDLKSKTVSSPSESNELKSEQIIKDLGAILLITEQDKPTVARVDNPSVLKSSTPEFYKDVQPADYIIVYPTRAIIYRTSNNQIINIAPILKTTDQSADANPQIIP